MSYVTGLLGRNETILATHRRHPLALLGPVVDATAWTIGGVLLAGLIGAIVPQITPVPNGVGIAIVALAVAPFAIAIGRLTIGYARWYFDQIVLTDYRLIRVSGVLNKRVADSGLTKINDLKLEISMWGRLLGYGDLTVLTAAETPDAAMDRVAGVVELKRRLLEAKAAHEARID